MKPSHSDIIPHCANLKLIEFVEQYRNGYRGTTTSERTRIAVIAAFLRQSGVDMGRKQHRMSEEARTRAAERLRAIARTYHEAVAQERAKEEDRRERELFAKLIEKFGVQPKTTEDSISA